MRPLPSSLRARQLSGYVCNSCTRQLRRQRHDYAIPSATTSHSEIYDLVCVGGGPAGLSLLAALRSNPFTQNLKVALIESQSLAPTRAFSPPPTQFSNRCSSLTPSSVKFLQDIGAWKFVRRERVQAYTEMRVWDGVSGASIDFSSAIQQGDDVVAYMNENSNLTAALLQRVEEIGGVDIFDGLRVENIRFGEDTTIGDFSSWPIVRLGDGRELCARLLVGADGANSPVRQSVNIESRGWDYGRVGVVATLRMEGEGWGGPERKIAYQRFLPTGPVAMLPLPGNFSTLVWSTTPELASRLKSLSHEDFISMINAAFRLSVADLKYLHTLPGGQEEEVSWRETHTPFENEKIPQRVISVQENSIASFPLKFRHADTYTAPRIALVGDAAHTVHPLAGQGLNQGQADVEALVRNIQYSVEHGMDIGAQISLEGYNSERYLKNHVLMGVVDKLHKLYGTENEVVVGLRSLGLRAVDGLGGLKGLIMGSVGGGRS